MFVSGRKNLKFRLIRCGLIVLIILVASYVLAAWIMNRKIRNDIREEHGDDYAIIALHMGGRPYAKPSLWRMLNVVYDYSHEEKYPPQGTGRYTGKQYYLTMLVSDNDCVRDCYWSFREFGMVFHDTIVPWDIIENLPEETAHLYSYTKESRVRHNGLWYSEEHLNHPNINFYYRLAPGAGGTEKQLYDLMQILQR